MAELDRSPAPPKKDFVLPPMLTSKYNLEEFKDKQNNVNKFNTNQEPRGVQQPASPDHHSFCQ